MATFYTSDKFMATVTTASGQQLATVSLSGFGSMAQLMRHIISKLNPTAGVIKLFIRNITQGWTASHSIRMSAGINCSFA